MIFQVFTHVLFYLQVQTQNNGSNQSCVFLQNLWEDQEMSLLRKKKMSNAKSEESFLYLSLTTTHSSENLNNPN